MSIATKRGDGGQTGLAGQRCQRDVSIKMRRGKSHHRLHLFQQGRHVPYEFSSDRMPDA